MLCLIPCVVITGGGFAGLAAARTLKKAAVRIILIDRMNHHVFQPLLYQAHQNLSHPPRQRSRADELSTRKD